MAAASADPLHRNDSTILPSTYIMIRSLMAVCHNRADVRSRAWH